MNAKQFFGRVKLNPPPSLPIQERLGAIGIRVDPSSYGCWRCARCNKMKRNGERQAWVEDSVLHSDATWSIKERQRARAWNGNFSAWCIDCAAKLLEND